MISENGVCRMPYSTAVEPDEIYGPEDHKPPVRESLTMSTIETYPPDGQRVVAGAIGGGLMGGSVAGPIGAAVGAIFGAIFGAATEENERRQREL